MFLRVNGLYGWVRTNDRRSIVLFAGFLAALNVTAVLVLYLPLLAFDPEHAPLLAWDGYASRYVPLVTLASAAFFALHLFWHVSFVQRVVGFRFLDDADEPRLCRLIEPLAIGMGLPAPYVGVVEAHALNAFACGLNRKNAVVVVTRGLIDELDDDELSAVLAHELAHIANGDIRLLAAANACLRVIDWLIRPRLKESSRLRELVAFPVIMIAMPPLFLFVLVMSFCAQSSLRASRLVRHLIASSREFIADAAAVETTQNPAALLSALQRIQGRSRLADLPPGQDAMMIDGPCEGAFATHPTIGRRMEAIVAVTGSVALIAPSRRDTRADAGRSIGGSAIRSSVFGGQEPLEHRGPSSGAAEGEKDRNWLGLTPTMTIGVVAAVLVFLGMHRHEFGRPAALVAALDPRPAGAIFAVALRGSACGVGALGSRALGLDAPPRCEGTALHDFTVAQARVGGPVGDMLASMTRAPDGMYVLPGGGFSNVLPDDAKAASVQADRCFYTKPYGRGDRGLHGIDDPPKSDGSFDIRRWLARTDALAGAAAATELDGSTKPLMDYMSARKLNYETIDRFFGEPGLAMARQDFAAPLHLQAIARLRAGLHDPRWSARLSPLERAEALLLVSDPDEFIPCVARRRTVAGQPAPR